MGILALGLFIAAYFPVFQLLVSKWAGSEEYTHAFLTVPIIVYMLWRNRTVLLNSSRHYAWIGLPIILLSTACYCFALLTQVDTVISLSMFLTTTGVLIFLAGPGAVKELFTPLLLFLMLIPVPEQLYTQITSPLQLKVSQFSEIIIRMFDVPILRQGNVMQLPGKSFEVVEACSGLRSVITLLTLSVILGFFMLRSKRSKLILIAASIPTAIMVNVIRIVSMILLYYYWNIDLVEGTKHTITGLLVFTLALFTLFFLQKILATWETQNK